MYNLTSSKNMSYITNSSLVLKDKFKLMENMDINKKTNKIVKNQFFKELINHNYENCKDIYKFTLLNTKYNIYNNNDVDDHKLPTELTDIDIINSKHFVVFLKNNFDFDSINKKIFESIINTSESILSDSILYKEEDNSSNNENYKKFSIKTLGLINLYYILYVDIVYFLKYQFKDCLFRSVKLISENKLNLEIVFPKKTEILRYDKMILKDKFKNLFNQIEIDFMCKLNMKTGNSEKDINKHFKLKPSEIQILELSEIGEFYKNLVENFNQHFDNNGALLKSNFTFNKNSYNRFLSQIQIVSLTDLLFIYNIDPIFISNKKTMVTFKDLIHSEGFNFEKYGNLSINNAKIVKLALLFEFLKAEKYFTYYEVDVPFKSKINNKLEDINDLGLNIICFNSKKLIFRYIINNSGLFEIQDKDNILNMKRCNYDFKYSLNNLNETYKFENNDYLKAFEKNTIHINNHFNYFFNKIEELQTIFEDNSLNNSNSDLFVQTLNSIVNLKMISLKNNTFKELDHLIANNCISTMLYKMNFTKFYSNFSTDTNVICINIGLIKYEIEKINKQCFLSLNVEIRVNENNTFEIQNFGFLKKCEEKLEVLSLIKFIKTKYSDLFSLLSDINSFKNKNSIIEIITILVKIYSFNLDNISLETEYNGYTEDKDKITIESLLFLKVTIKLGDQSHFINRMNENYKNLNLNDFKRCSEIFETVVIELKNFKNFNFDLIVNSNKIKEFKKINKIFDNMDLKFVNDLVIKENANDSKYYNVKYFTNFSKFKMNNSNDLQLETIRFENIVLDQVYIIKQELFRYMIFFILKTMIFNYNFTKQLSNEVNFLKFLKNVLKLTGNEIYLEKISKFNSLSDIEGLKISPIGFYLFIENKLVISFTFDCQNEFKMFVLIDNNLEIIFDNKMRKIFSSINDVFFYQYAISRIKFIVFKNSFKKNLSNDVVIPRLFRNQNLINSYNVKIPISIIICLKHNDSLSNMSSMLKYVLPMKNYVVFLLSEQECKIELLSFNNMNMIIYEDEGKILIKLSNKNGNYRGKLSLNNESNNLTSVGNTQNNQYYDTSRNNVNSINGNNNFLPLLENRENTSTNILNINSSRSISNQELSFLNKIKNYCRYNLKHNAFELKCDHSIEKNFEQLVQNSKHQIDMFSKLIKDILN